MSDEDKDKWQDHVDRNILYDRLEDVRARLKELEKKIEGKGGLLSEYERHDDKLTRLYAVIFQDPTGQKGLLHDVDVLMGRRKDKDENRTLKWQFWGAIVVAVITSGAVVLSNLSKIKGAFLRVDPLQASIDRAKRPSVHKKIIRYRHLPAQDESEGD